MRCVCGCPRWAHRTVLASVPLPAGRAQYAVTHPSGVYTYPDATYDQQQCPCGCTLFESDTG